MNNSLILRFLYKGGNVNSKGYFSLGIYNGSISENNCTHQISQSAVVSKKEFTEIAFEVRYNQQDCMRECKQMMNQLSVGRGNKDLQFKVRLNQGDNVYEDEYSGYRVDNEVIEIEDLDQFEVMFYKNKTLELRFNDHNE